MKSPNKRLEEKNIEEQIERCRCWLELGPRTYKGNYYIKSWGDEINDPIEQIKITTIPEDIAVIIEISWETAMKRGKTFEDSLKIFSEELHYELPFRNRKNADIYATFEMNSEELRDKYIDSFNPTRTLKSLFETQDANCVAHALAIKEIIPDKKFQIFNNYYDYTENPEHLGKVGIHTILAKIVYGRIYAIDTSEGPVAHKDKYNPFKYQMTMEHFAKNYIPAYIRNTPILK